MNNLLIKPTLLPRALVAHIVRPDYSCIRLATPATLFSMHALHAAEYITSLAEAIMRWEDSTSSFFIQQVNKHHQITGDIVSST